MTDLIHDPWWDRFEESMSRFSELACNLPAGFNNSFSNVRHARVKQSNGTHRHVEVRVQIIAGDTE